MKYIDAEKLIKAIEEKGLDCSFALKMERLDTLALIDELQYEQPMPDSTQLIELWHKDKEMLKEKDFRDDQWRLAYNAYMCGFGRGVAVKKEESPEGICSCRWKPSKVQMKYLDIAIAEANGHKSYNLADGLEKIKDDLKKL